MRITGFIALIFIALIPANLFSQPRYTVTILPAPFRIVDPDLGSISGAGLNNLGHVVYQVPRNVHGTPLLWTGGPTSSYFLPTGTPRGINDHGLVCGQLSGSPYHYAFGWTTSNGVMPIGSFPTYSRAAAVNNSGQIAGTYSAPGDHGRPFIWSQNAGVQTLPMLSGRNYSVELWDINEHGHVVGGALTYPFKIRDAYRWKGGATAERLPKPIGYPDAIAFGLNDDGDAVGVVRHPLMGSAYLWLASGETRYLTVPGDTYNEAYAINNQGQIVGVTDNSVEGPRAVLWDVDGEPYLLQDVIDIDAKLLKADRINESGQILAYGRVPGDARYLVFLLTPTNRVDLLSFVKGL
jgi:uncharacterized membrane protein